MKLTKAQKREKRIAAWIHQMSRRMLDRHDRCRFIAMEQEESKAITAYYAPILKATEELAAEVKSLLKEFEGYT